MLSTSKMDAKAADQTKSVAQPTLEKNDNVDKIKAELEEKVQSIQQAFDSAWGKSPPESNLSQICYFTSDAGAAASRGTQIQSLLGKFKSYENVQQIKDDFWNLKRYCSNQCDINKVSQLFGDSYLISLHLMEALFTRAFMDNLSYVMQSTPPMSDPVSEETESKVDFESIAEKVKNNYEADLHDRLFADESKALIAELSEGVVDLGRQIDLYHEKCEKLFEVKPLSAEDNSPDDPVPKPIKQLLSDELAYASLCISNDISDLKSTQQALIEARQALLVKHNQLIDAFLTTIRAKVVPVQIDCDAIPELSPLAAELRQAEAAISSINEQNKLRLGESNAVFRSKEIIIANKELKGRSLQEYVLAKKPLFSMSALWKEYDQVLKYLEPHVKKIDNYTSPTPIAVTKWTEKRDSIAEKLEAKKKQLIEIINNKISSEDFIQKREEIIRKEGDSLRQKACSNRKILPFASDVLLKKRRAELDKQWEILLASEENIEIFKSIPGKFFRASDKRSDVVQKEALIQTAGLINVKLKLYRTPSKKAIDADKKAAVSQEPADTEKKTSPQDQVAKPVLSVDSAQAQGFQFVDEEAKLNPAAPVRLYGSVQFKDEVESSLKPKQHWYSRFVDKPWKRALLVGLGVFVVAGLAATGVGLLLEAPLTILLAVALGGGAGAGLLTGGVTYACTSHGHEPPRQIAQQVKPENALTKNELIDRRRSIMLTASAPSVFPVYAPNVLSDPESTSCFDWFLRRRKEHRVDPPAQKIGNQPKRK